MTSSSFPATLANYVKVSSDRAMVTKVLVSPDIDNSIAWFTDTSLQEILVLAHKETMEFYKENGPRFHTRIRRAGGIRALLVYQRRLMKHGVLVRNHECHSSLNVTCVQVDDRRVIPFMENFVTTEGAYKYYILVSYELQIFVDNYELPSNKGVIEKFNSLDPANRIADSEILSHFQHGSVEVGASSEGCGLDSIHVTSETTTKKKKSHSLKRRNSQRRHDPFNKISPNCKKPATQTDIAELFKQQAKEPSGTKEIDLENNTNEFGNLYSPQRDRETNSEISMTSEGSSGEVKGDNGGDIQEEDSQREYKEIAHGGNQGGYNEASDCVESSQDCVGTSQDCMGTGQEYVGTDQDCMGSSQDCMGTDQDCVGTAQDCVGTGQDCVGSSQDCVGSSQEGIDCSNSQNNSFDRLALSMINDGNDIIVESSDVFGFNDSQERERFEAVIDFDDVNVLDGETDDDEFREALRDQCHPSIVEDDDSCSVVSGTCDSDNEDIRIIESQPDPLVVSSTLGNTSHDNDVTFIPLGVDNTSNRKDVAVKTSRNKPVNTRKKPARGKKSDNTKKGEAQQTLSKDKRNKAPGGVPQSNNILSYGGRQLPGKHPPCESPVASSQWMSSRNPRNTLLPLASKKTRLASKKTNAPSSKPHQKQSILFSTVKKSSNVQSSNVVPEMDSIKVITNSNNQSEEEENEGIGRNLKRNSSRQAILSDTDDSDTPTNDHADSTDYDILLDKYLSHRSVTVSRSDNVVTTRGMVSCGLPTEGVVPCSDSNSSDETSHLVICEDENKDLIFVSSDDEGYDPSCPFTATEVECLRQLSPEDQTRVLALFKPYDGNLKKVPLNILKRWLAIRRDTFESIYRSKIPSRRHTVFHEGSNQDRASLRMEMKSEMLTVRQYEMITDVLNDIFCSRSTKRFTYMYDVIVGEAVIYLLMDFYGQSYDQAEYYMFNYTNVKTEHFDL